MIINQKKELVDLDSDLDQYGAIDPSFTIPEYHPNMFNEIVHNCIRFTSESLKENWIKNLSYGTLSVNINCRYLGILHLQDDISYSIAEIQGKKYIILIDIERKIIKEQLHEFFKKDKGALNYLIQMDDDDKNNTYYFCFWNQLENFE